MNSLGFDLTIDHNFVLYSRKDKKIHFGTLYEIGFEKEIEASDYVIINEYENEPVKVTEERIDRYRIGVKRLVEE